ncbi:uncharacterized protein LOC126672879 isoform X2 [Mercurialis annua]|uniref:uncharacterized protein LOC126672879 isoform X2 n=1 Tax=Mercurialis annua TaxID=3986 RepID=UPI00215FEE31|nr:uncharacterized protein LOC126672879 isoform X2 [Mercurialis annua]
MAENDSLEEIEARLENEGESDLDDGVPQLTFDNVCVNVSILTDDEGRGMPPPNGPGTFIDEDTGVSILHPGSKAATLLFGPYGSSHSQVQPQRPVKLDTRRPQQRKGKEVVTTSQLQK